MLVGHVKSSGEIHLRSFLETVALFRLAACVAAHHHRFHLGISRCRSQVAERRVRAYSNRSPSKGAARHYATTTGSDEDGAGHFCTGRDASCFSKEYAMK